MGRIRSLLLSAIALVLTVSAQAVAQTPLSSDTAALKREQDALFQRILKQPHDLDASFRHAEVSTALGDYEASIGSLERMLFYNPALPRVMLELGVLYFRLGSYEMARVYFTNAVEAPDTPAEVRARVQAFLAEIDKRLNPNQTIAFFQTGVRYQSNANAGPDGTLVRVFGLDAVLDREFVKAPDWNWFAQGVVRNVIDFGNQRGDSWETTLAGYASVHDRFGRLDTLLADVQTGPRFALFPDRLSGWSVRPHIGVSAIRLGGSHYMSTQSVGGSLMWIPTPGWGFEVGFERSQRNYRDTADYPTADQQSGMADLAYVALGGPLVAGWTWSVRGAISDVDARVDWQSYRQAAVSVSLSYTIPVPVFGKARPLTLVPFASYRRAEYDSPDPFVDPLTVREDKERSAGLGIDLLITDRVGIGIRGQYTKSDSTLPNYEFENLSVYAGPTLRY